MKGACHRDGATAQGRAPGTEFPYFFNVNISLSMHDIHLKLYICIKNIAVEGTMSQIFY